MQTFLRQSLQRQLTVFGLLASLGGLCVAGGALLAFELRSLRSAMVRDLERTAAVIAANATVALSFDNATDAREILGTLRADPQIVTGCIFLPTGAAFACYERDAGSAGGSLGLEDDGHRYAGGYLTTALGIQHDGRRLGTIVLRSDTTAFAALVRQYVIVFVTVLLGGVVVAFWLSTRLQRFISDPVLRLVDAMGRVPSRERRRIEGEAERGDEIGLLIRGFNDMLGEIERRDAALERAQRELVATSRQAGMSEVATDVLHNVGNVLNSVNVSCSLVTERMRTSQLSRLSRLAGLLEAHAQDLGAFVGPAGEGRVLPQYVRALTDQLGDEQAAALRELDALARNVEHIKIIVAQQQSYARTAGMREVVAAAQVVEDAMQLNRTRMERHRITVTREFAAVPDLCVDRHRMLQILVNLVANAVQALVEGSGEHRELTIAITSPSSDRLWVIVRDTGIGIPAENLTRIFQHGFTTKQEGHGFGLHSAGLAAKEMGGTLTAASPGPGRGATFTLELPIAAPEAFDRETAGGPAPARS